MKALLIQIRHIPQVIEEEYNSFLKYSGLGSEELTTLNVFETYPEPHHLEGIDGVFIGGASAANVLEPEVYTFMPALIEFIKFCLKRDIPTFASCFGFQAAVLALGGEIIDDSLNYEMGTVQISLTEAAKSDLIYKGTHDQFYAVSVHQQKAIDLPENCELLAYTKDCIHSFKVRDKRFWTFQFHPEVDKQTLIDRLKVYQEKYTSGDLHYDEVILTAVDTDASNLLVKMFVDRVLRKA